MSLSWARNPECTEPHYLALATVQYIKMFRVDFTLDKSYCTQTCKKSGSWDLGFMTIVMRYLTYLTVENETQFDGN